MSTKSTTTRELHPSGTARLTIDIPRDTHRRLRVHAAEKETTMTSIVLGLLATALTNEDAGHINRR